MTLGKTCAPHCSRAINFYACTWGGGLTPARRLEARGGERRPGRPVPAPGGRLQPAGRARARGSRGSRSAARRLLTLHVFRHLALFPMRSSQSQGFRLHFGQHDKTAAGGNGGSVSVRKPSTWTRQHGCNSGGEKEGATGVPARPPARRSVPPPPPGCRAGPLSPVLSRGSGAAPALRGRDRGYHRRRRRRRPGALVRLREGGGGGGGGEGAAARGADPRTAELPAGSAGGRGAATATAAVPLPLLPDGSATPSPRPPPSGSGLAGVSLSP